MNSILQAKWRAKSFTSAIVAFLFWSFTAFASNEKTDLAPKAASSAQPQGFKQPESLAELLALPPKEVEKVDIARIDLLCAEGLSGSEDLNLDYCIRTLNGWAEYVKSETKRNQHLFDEHPERFKNSVPYFRMAMLATVLCQDLRTRYNPEREKQLENGHILRSDKDEKKFFEDSKDVFIHGLIAGKHYGTCASMPFLYVAIARRLGYPVTLATTATHFYVRYEEEKGKHLNVEATEHRAFLTPSDEEYKNPWELHVSDEEVSGMRYLQPLNNKEILGHALLTRSAVLRSMAQFDKQAETWAAAARYLPDTPMWKGIEHDMQLLARNEGEQERRNAMWNEIAQLYVPHGAGFAYFQDKKVRLHLLMNHSTDTAAIQKTMQEFEHELRDYVKTFIEPGNRPAIQPSGESGQRLVLRYTTASGNVATIPAEFVPPFDSRIIPPEVAQRVAGKKLEDEESILAEFWAFYDEMAQARHEAMRRKIQQRASPGYQAMISEESVPPEYRQSIPWELDRRLNGLKDGQDIVNEMWAYRQEQQIRQQDEQRRKRMAAVDRVRSVMEHAGIHPSFSYFPSPESRVGIPKAREEIDLRYQVPEMYQEWITPEIARRLSSMDLWFLQQDERNEQVFEAHRKMANQLREEGRIRQMPSYQIVPAAIADGNPAVEHPSVPVFNSQNSPLTPSSQSERNPVVNGKGKQ